ncbi:MAG: DUF3300 domain-containing protein [Alphaproteobacteria bacterium]|nr:DUF3300 domain-containing protein [Alphaproteobacteria bacterium]
MLALALQNPGTVYGQAAPPPASPAAGAQPPPTQPAPAQPAPPAFRTEELDQILAPIALYPDPLLAQILMASTYPLEIVQAERWVRDPNNAKLKGDELAAALEKQTWDPSVKSLVPFPQVLGMMSDKLDWTQRLGDAFLAQQADVMNSVQRLRRQAQDAGKLQSTEQQTVSTQGSTVVIQPADPQVVYVPSYNPTVVYGTWPYPAYPPYYYPPPPAYYPGYYAGSALVSGMAFATGVAIVGSLWGWGSCNWGHGDVNINTNRYNTINNTNIQSGRATQLQSNANTWRHDSSHRAGVAYRDPATRQAYQRQPAQAASRDYRGYDGTRTGAAASGSSTRATAASRPQAQSRPQPQSRPQAQSGSPAAFQGMGNGRQVQAQADRGRASMQSAGGASARYSAPSARAGGGMGRAGGGGGGGFRGR